MVLYMAVTLEKINKIGYFNIELIKPISPIFFDDKKRSICILAASSILKVLLPELQLNKKIYNSFENLLNKLSSHDWIKLYILWELSLVKELGYEIDLPDVKDSINANNYTITSNKNYSKDEIAEALIFSKSLLLENFVFPNKIKFPLSRNILEKYFN